MNILLYAVASWTTVVNDGCDEVHDVNYNHYAFLLNFLGNSLIQSKDVQIKSFLPEICLYHDEKANYYSNLNPISITMQDIINICPNAKSYQEIFFKSINDSFLQDEEKRFEDFIKNALKNWKPDVIISYPHCSNMFKRLFPESLCLNYEFGIVSRPPFPRTLKFDAISFFNGFLNKFSKEINSFEINEQQKCLVQNFICDLNILVNKNNPYIDELMMLKEKYKYLVLCPIITSNAYNEAKMDDQIFYLDYVMKNIPKNIGVIISFHDTAVSQLNCKNIEFLKTKYENLIYFENNSTEWISKSLNFFPFVDAVLNSFSMTGIQALLFDCRLISLDKSYSSGCCEKIGLDNIEEFLDSPKKDNTSLIYWLLTHFSIFDKHFNEEDWFYNYFKVLFNNYRKYGISFNLYPQIEDFEEISEYIKSRIQDYYNIKQQSQVSYNIKPSFIIKIKDLFFKLKKIVFVITKLCN